MNSRRPDLDGLDREIRDHIDAETEDNIARGMSREDAYCAAIRKFGNLARVKEDVRGVWIPGWIDRLRQDARDAFRQLRRNPGFSFAIIVTLALGIGLTTAIYSVVNAVLMRPLAYPHPDRDRVAAGDAHRNHAGHDIMNSIDFATWQSQSTSLAHMVGYGYVGLDARRWRGSVAHPDCDGVGRILAGKRRPAAAWRVADVEASRTSSP